MNSHIFRGGPQSHLLTVVIHANVTGTNAVGTPLGAALILSGLVSGESVLPPGDGTNGTISNDEAELLATGQRVEFVEQFPVTSDWDTLNNAGKAAAVNAWRTAVLSDKQAELQRVLNYFGIAFN